MPYFPVGANTRVGKGALFFAPDDSVTGDPTEGERFLGNLQSFGFGQDVQKVELLDNTNPGGGVVDSTVLSQKLTATVALNEIPLENVEIFFSGSIEAANQAADTAATKSFLNIVLDRHYQLGAYDVTNVVGLAGGTTDGFAPGAGNVGNGVMGTITRTNPKAGVFTLTMTSSGPTAAFSVTDPDGIALPAGAVASAYNQGGLAFTLADGSTDFAIGDSFTITESAPIVLGTDYELDAEHGTIHPLSTSAVLRNGIGMFFTFDQPAKTMNQLNMLTGSSKIGRLVYRANDANVDAVGAKDIIECWNCELTPSGEFQLISDTYISFTLAISVRSDVPRHTGDYKYGRIIRKS